MQREFRPMELMSTRNIIIEKHKKMTSLTEEVIDFGRQKKLLDKIIKMSTDQIKRYALTLTDNDVKLICYYIMENQYNLDLQNISEVIIARLDDSNSELLFEQWQRFYHGNSSKYFFEKLLQGNQYLKIENLNITSEMQKKWFVSSNIPIAVIETCRLRHDDNIKKSLEYYHINSASELSWKCQILYFTGCDRNEYLKVLEIDLYNIIIEFTYDEFQLFLVNFVNQLELEDLEKYFKIAEIAIRYTGMNHEPRYKEYFRTISNEIEEKYHAWINYYELFKIFGNDNRSRFWKQYAVNAQCNFKYYKTIDLLFLKFKDYVFTEFKGGGPIYLFEKNEFDLIIEKKLIRFTKNNELRSWLFGSYNASESGFLDRIAHNSGWEYKVRNHIRKKRIILRGE